jgi:hypothetical protein
MTEEEEEEEEESAATSFPGVRGETETRNSEGNEATEAPKKGARRRVNPALLSCLLSLLPH